MDKWAEGWLVFDAFRNKIWVKLIFRFIGSKRVMK